MPQYQGVWNLQDAARLQSIQQWVTDPQFKQTTLLLQGDSGANGAQNNTFYDTSPNQFAITRNGNTTQGSFTPFSNQPGAWGNYFDGSSLISVADNNVFDFGTGDFTVETWAYHTNVASSVNTYYEHQTGGLIWYRNATGYLEVAVSGGSVLATSTVLVPVNSWCHLVVARSGTTLQLFMNGLSVASVTNSTNLTSTNIVRVGSNSSTLYFVGYLSNFRITKGGALYTSAFTPSPIPLTTTVSAGTVSLLTCQSNRFVDNSSNAFAITTSGTPSVQPFSPFAPQYQWTSSVIGGSGYFDGSGDYLSITDQEAFNLGTNNFTLEGWFYALAYPNYARLFGQCTEGATGNNSIGFFFDTGGNGATCNMRWGTTANQTNDSGYVTVNAGKNQWHHIVATRDGNTLRMYFDGVQVYSTSVAGLTFYNSTADFRIGASSNASPAELWNGYLSGVRLVNGTCLYPNGTTFTPPILPPTSVTNTALLTNFTNAGIYDGTMKNDLETVGNAQISTSVVKYGSGSMYFDGSGDNLTIPWSQNFNFGSGDFTIEGWIYPAQIASAAQVITSVRSGAANFGLAIYQNTTTLQLYLSSANASWDIANAATIGTVAANTWYHFAVSRSGSSIRAFLNGVLGSTTTTSSSVYAWGTPLLVGSAGATAFEYFSGYLDDVRVTKGFARYTANFTPPQVALPRQ